MIDTHLHLWNPARHRYPWLDEIPALNREFTLAKYHAACGGQVSESVFIECAAGPESFFDEARWILDLASKPASGIEGVVASVWPERENFSGLLLALSSHPKLKGVRRVLHTEPDDLSRSALFRENVRALADSALTFDLCVLERQLPVAIELVDACPEVTFILDHCGVPDIAANLPGFWKTQIAEIARRPNVVCKVSGLLLYADESRRNPAGLLPWFSHVVEHFGWDRLLWGGDWPVCTLAASLADWISVTHDLLDLANSSPSVRKAFLEDNAKKIYRL